MQRYIVHWGEMGSRWGLNRSVAQIHALLYLSPEPLNADEIAETLGIARSNVSVGLKELLSWNLVHVTQTLGDRRDFFVAQRDPWEVVRVIVEGRKRFANAASDPLIRGKLELRVPIGRAFWDGHRLELTLTEFTILQTLAETPKRDFSYREIYDIVRGKGFIAGWGEEGYRVNVRSFIKRIRQKFRAIDENFDCIKNYSGYGYYWDHGE